MKNVNKSIPAIAGTINADLIPKVKKWLSKHHPDAAFTDCQLSTLMCYATTPEDFKVPTPSDAHEAIMNGKTISTLKDALKLIPDMGLIEIHKLMLKHPRATAETICQFQHQDRLRLNDIGRRALRAMNKSGLSANAIVDELIKSGRFKEHDAGTLRRRINQMRNEDLENIDPKNLRFYE